jgi:hypothetical protein
VPYATPDPRAPSSAGMLDAVSIGASAARAAKDCLTECLNVPTTGAIGQDTVDSYVDAMMATCASLMSFIHLQFSEEVATKLHMEVVTLAKGVASQIRVKMAADPATDSKGV